MDILHLHKYNISLGNFNPLRPHLRNELVFLNGIIKVCNLAIQFTLMMINAEWCADTCMWFKSYFTYTKKTWIFIKAVNLYYFIIKY